MRRADELTTKEAREFVESVHKFFYWNEDKRRWLPDMDTSGADLVDYCGGLFRVMRMVPPPESLDE